MPRSMFNYGIYVFMIRVATGCFRLRNVPTKDSLADLPAKFLPAEGLRSLCKLLCLRSSTVYYTIHDVMQHDYRFQLAHNSRMNKLHGYLTLQVAQFSTSHYHLSSHVLHHMLSFMLQTLFIYFVTCYPGL